MSNKGFTHHDVRYVIDDDALDSKIREFVCDDDDDDNLESIGDDTLIALTGALLHAGFDINDEEALKHELIRRSGCYVAQMLIDEGIAKAQVESNDG